MIRHGAQQKLLDIPQQLPNGLIYRPDFLTKEEERVLLEYLARMPLVNAPFGDYVSKRRHLGFGWGFDREREEFIRGEALPPFLVPLQNKIAKWTGVSKRQVVEALINEYSPGSGLGWHRDRERFETIVGISFGSWARMRFRPLSRIGDSKAVVSVELEPRSVYVMQGDVRWKWQHSVAPTKALRYSITFRTVTAEEARKAPRGSQGSC
jgi:alkylated DNA repair dioxygenase AlkB